MIRVLLADDHATVRDALQLLIDAEPDMTVVGVASNGDEAIASVTKHAPDVLVLDLSMKGMGGLAAVRALQNQRSPTRMIVLTRHDDNAYVQELMHAGASAYVLKRSPSAELLQAIRVTAGGGRHLDAGLTPAAADAERRPQAPPISNRERQVLRMLALGQSNKEIATALEISVKTVEVHKANAMRKLDLRGRTDIVRFAMLNGWLSDG